MQPVKPQDEIQAATAVYHALLSRRLAERYKAVESLENPGCPIDLPTLRTLLKKGITQDYYAGKEVEQVDDEISTTRSWLLEVLARISDGDDEATRLVLEHLDEKVEPDRWIRHWALEGLIAGKNRQAETAARQAAKDREPLVSMLGTAFLASLRDAKAMEKVREDLENDDHVWEILRALRIVPLPFTAQSLCTIVEKAEYTDVTYDAVIALGNIPCSWNHAQTAVQALSASILKMRGSPWQDGMRTAAIGGLRRLRAESSAPLVLEELVDDNPAIVREAARAIVEILGLEPTVIRVVEAAAKGGPSTIEAYARALRWLNRDAIAEELETLMVSGSMQQQDVARALLSELGGTVAFEKLRARTDAMKQYTDTLEKTEEKIRDLFDASVREAQSGFHIAVMMDEVVFTLGVLLLAASATAALLRAGDLNNWAGIGITGGLGVLGIVYGVLISNPRRQVRESVDHLMEVKIMFLAYLRRLHQADQAYTRRLLDDEPITVKQVEMYANIVGNIMESTLHWQTSTDGENGQKKPVSEG